MTQTVENPAFIDSRVGVAILDISHSPFGPDASFIGDVAAASSTIDGLYAQTPNALQVGIESIDTVLDLSQYDRTISPAGIQSLGVTAVILPTIDWENDAATLNDMGIGVGLSLRPNGSNNYLKRTIESLMDIMRNAPSTIVSTGQLNGANPKYFPSLGAEVGMLDLVHSTTQKGEHQRPDVYTRSLDALQACAEITRQQRAEIAERNAADNDRAQSRGQLFLPRFPRRAYELPLGTSRLGWIAPLDALQVRRDARTTARRIDTAVNLGRLPSKVA